MKNNRGVTLVALVITIIVLLILAGVSLAMLSGDNGILTNAQKAKSDTVKANVRDSINNTYMELLTEAYAKTKTFDADLMKDVANHYCNSSEVTVGEPSGTGSSESPLTMTLTPVSGTGVTGSITLRYDGNLLTRSGTLTDE